MTTRTVHIPCHHGRTYSHLIEIPRWSLRRGFDRIDDGEFDWEDDNHCGGGHSEVEYLIEFGHISFWMTVPGISVATSSYFMQGWDLGTTIDDVMEGDQ